MNQEEKEEIIENTLNWLADNNVIVHTEKYNLLDLIKDEV